MNSHSASRLTLVAAFVVGGTLGLAAPMAQAATSANDTGAESAQPATDTWITTKVKTALLAESDVAGTDINVSTSNGVVTLAGVLSTKAEVDRAVAIARDIEGVVDVDTRALTWR
jgi:hyperosmotically inducible periplasmic protein